MNDKTVGVVGLGLLGRGIAACFLSHGFRVVGVTPSAAEHDAARAQMSRMMDESAARDAARSQFCQSWERRFRAVTTFDELGPCDFVVESVPEDVSTKESVYSLLESVLADSAVIASNTSSIPISVLQERRRRPERLVGMHWAQPAHLTRFCELVRGERTSADVLDIAMNIARTLGKDPSLCQRDIPGFIANRLGYALYREALHLIEEGVTDADTIDRSIRNSLGLWASVCGPLRWIDVSGGPVLYARAMERIAPTLSNSTGVPVVLQKLADDDARGITNGRGFYSYTSDESRYWEELCRGHAAEVEQTLQRHFPIEVSDR
jgi:3-hydroxybutyryl-CoA dehydrogenase